MDETANTFKQNSRILISRNRPVAVIANTCTFLGSALANHLLDKGIQVIAIDDLTVFDKHKLGDAIKNKDFHLVNFPFDNDQVIDKISQLKLERLDYGFFITDKSVPDIITGRGIINFIEIAKQIRDIIESASEKKESHADKPRLAFISSINLYGKSLDQHDRVIKEAEVKFAKGIKHYKLNGRVIRLAEVFGPGMEFETSSPLALLIEASIAGKLEEIPTSMDFTERSLYIDDAISLLVKSVLSGATSNKIYDGALLHPIKLSDIKQILSDPMWFEEQKAEISKLPAWPTPNLVKTIKELSWAGRTPVIKALRETVAYFKEHSDQIPQRKEKRALFGPEMKTAGSDKSWSFVGTGFLGEEPETPEEKKLDKQSGNKLKRENFDKEYKRAERNTFFGRAKRGIGFLIIAGLLIYGLIWPGVYLAYQGFSIRQNILSSKASLEKGDFEESENSIEKAGQGIEVYEQLLDSSKILQKIPVIGSYYQKANQLVGLAKEGINGVGYATRGSKSLFETTKIVSGESREDPNQYYQAAEINLGFASEKLSRVYAALNDENLKKGLPVFMGTRIDELKDKLQFYTSLVEQTKSASQLMPKITGLEGKKSYLVLLQNNLELRPTGGFIGSYAKLDFENGRLSNIKVDDIYSLDGTLKDVIAPPPDLMQDLGIDRLYLRDSNYEPDFPTAARQASFFYKKEAGESVHGVIALDLKASGNLLDAIGGLDLPEYGEAVNGSNLFERAISHAEAGFFPGSQAKKNYLTSLQTQMFNKIFYLSKQNWPAIIGALSKSLEQKHIMVYLEDPALFSYLASSNWSGVFPRSAEKRDGETNDFLAVIESNMGANKANYYLQRKYNLASSFTKEGKIQHQLKITYKNTSPSEIFPAGIYKNRVKLYLPQGSKLTRALLGEDDITQKFSAFSDYGRSGFSGYIQIMPKEQKQLIFEYELADSLIFKDNQALYKIELFKQPGTMADPLDYVLTYPINFKLEEKPVGGTSGVQEVKINTDMLTDRVFQFRVKK